MGQYIAKRLLLLIPTVLGVTLIVFLTLRLLPGDPAQVMLGDVVDPTQVAQLRHELGLDRPLYVQYLKFVADAFRGNLGDSVVQKIPVRDILIQAFPNTFELTVVALLISVIVAVPLGVLAAVKQNSIIDHLCIGVALIGVSMPIFWLGILLILLLSVKASILPPFGQGVPLGQAVSTAIHGGGFGPLADAAKHVVLPAISLGLAGTGLLARLTRSSMLEVLHQDYVRTAQAKGLSSRRVVIGHALRNSLLPTITIIGLQFGALLGGAVITETIFAWPGVGRIVVQAINQRDFPLIQGSVLAIAVLFILVNLVTDIAYAFIDPRVTFR